MTDEELRSWAIEQARGDITHAQALVAFVRPSQGDARASRKKRSKATLWGAFSDERDALLAQKWSTEPSKAAITAEVNALPGPVVTARQVESRAVNVLGLRRPDFVSSILAAGRLARRTRENGAEPPQ